MVPSISVAFVTGANRGIGRAFVDALLEQGATRIYAAARDPAHLETLGQLDRRVRAVVLDVRNATDAAAAASEARDVTLLINNAGTLSIGSPAVVPITAVERHESQHVDDRTPAVAAYTVSKAAALSLTQSFRADLSKRGITVNGACHM